MEEIRRREQDNTPKWLTEIDMLAGGNPERWDYYFNLPITQGLNTWSFKRVTMQKQLEQIEQATRTAGADGALVQIGSFLLFTR